MSITWIGDIDINLPINIALDYCNYITQHSQQPLLLKEKKYILNSFPFLDICIIITISDLELLCTYKLDYNMKDKNVILVNKTSHNQNIEYNKLYINTYFISTKCQSCNNIPNNKMAIVDGCCTCCMKLLLSEPIYIYKCNHSYCLSCFNNIFNKTQERFVIKYNKEMPYPDINYNYLSHNNTLNDHTLNVHRQSDDWKMFWIIENKNIDELKQLCEELKNKNKDIGFYFKMAYWKNIFTEEEAKNIKVYMCGVMDFCPLQHANDIGWLDGVKCLIDYNIGTQSQGSGLNVVDIEKNSSARCKKSILTLYYVPWSGYCQQILENGWKKFKEKYNNDLYLQSKIIIDEVSLTENKYLCEKNNVNGFPTIRLKNNTSEYEYEYARDRTADDICQFVYTHIN